MNYFPDTEAEKLLEEAKRACDKSYSPYSGFPVGAAVLTRIGAVYTGTNIENASYSLTVCAERVALGKAISEGDSEIIAIAIYAPVDSISPCGACRQFIIEFGKDIVIIFRHDKELIQRTMQELLPFQFIFPDR